MENDVALPHWFCVRTHPKSEHIAAHTLETRLGMEILCPRIRFRKPTVRGPVWFTEALFPGYIFAHFDFLENQRNVRYAQGVSTIVQFGGRFPILDSATVEGLREICAGGIRTVEPELETGDEVRVAAGPFTGALATVHTLLPAKERVRILLEFLGEVRAIDVERNALVSTGNPGSLLASVLPGEEPRA